ncbi:MAG TPA: hypothetical protein VHB48_01220 [Chitinophagaceae bacterium]|nr:hypothetical protein [Chitinophagaceae bacterium]
MQKLLFFVLLTAMLPACTGRHNGSPKEVLSKFLTAMEKSDFAEAKKYATDDSQDFLEQLEKHTGETENIYSDKTFNVSGVQVNGDNAKADVQASTGTTISFNLKYQHDAWKVSFNMTAIMQMVTDIIKKEGMDIGKDVTKALDSVKINLDSLP